MDIVNFERQSEGIANGVTLGIGHGLYLNRSWWGHIVELIEVGSKSEAWLYKKGKEA